MADRCCPCGIRLNRSSATRPLKSPCLRMFMSIRMMKSLTSEMKVCNVCRILYRKWKQENPEFRNILNLLETDRDEFDDNDTIIDGSVSGFLRNL